MEYLLLDTLAADGATEQGYAFVDQGLNELGLGSYMPSEGDPIEPELTKPLTLKVDPGRRIKLGTLIGNTHAYLLMSREGKECLQELCRDVRIEYVPFTLLGRRKNQVLSRDYFVINPIGAFDCMHRQATDIVYFVKPGSPADGRILDVRHLVLDSRKLAGAPPLFRIKDWCRTYVISETVAAEFQRRGFTNIELYPIPQVS